MWYEQGDQPKQVRKDKPIFAKWDGSVFILLPQIGTAGSYSLCGYNWFDIANGRYNSNVFYKTIEDAIRAYDSYKISNGRLIISFEDTV